MGPSQSTTFVVSGLRVGPEVPASSVTQPPRSLAAIRGSEVPAMHPVRPVGGPMKSQEEAITPGVAGSFYFRIFIGARPCVLQLLLLAPEAVAGS